MPIFVGGTEINDIKIGNTEINEVYVGANKVWERGQSFTVTTEYRTFTLSSSSNPTVVKQSGYFKFSLHSNVLTSSGAVSPTSINLGGGSRNINELSWQKMTSSTFNFADVQFFIVSDTDIGNSGFTSMTVGNTTFNRTNATYSIVNVSTDPSSPIYWITWTWASASNPFGTGTGNSTQTVVFA
jgi:hypothetical protein